jgi:glutathione S-transferase
MAVKLHRCGGTWIKGPHPCWQVQKALDEAGIEYEVVKEPLRRSKRQTTIEKTGQKLYPWLELEDGRALREESKQLVERIRAGRLDAD